MFVLHFSQFHNFSAVYLNPPSTYILTEIAAAGHFLAHSPQPKQYSTSTKGGSSGSSLEIALLGQTSIGGHLKQRKHLLGST